MAPQGPQQTFYGSVPMDSQKEERPNRFLRRAFVTTGVVVLVSLAVFVASSSLHKAETSVNVEAERSGHKGDNLEMWKPDCHCRYGKCPNTADSDGKTYCGVTEHSCMGTDYGPAVDKDGKSVRYNKDIDCKKEGANKKDSDSPCRAVCDVIEGRNQCDKFPCLNGGWCKDGKDSFKCFCKAGWSGDTCADNIDECLLEGDKKVCNKYAICKDAPGTYSCKCKDGFHGMGYADASKVDPPSWMEKIYKDNKDKKGWVYGCEDVDDCAEKKCLNEGTCINAFGVLDGWSCKCKKGKNTKRSLYVEGGTCSVDFDECKEGTHDCDENALCRNQEGPKGDGFKCECKNHWTPKDPTGNDHHGRNNRVEVTGSSTKKKPDGTKYVRGCYDIDDCNVLKPCRNGGTCEEGEEGCVDPTTKKPVDCYRCHCVVGWSGKNCDDDEDECVDSMVSDRGQKRLTPYAPCRKTKSATCVNTAGSFGCRCNLGWTGDGITCVDANDCEFSPCAHGGTCNDCGTLCFSCNCVVGWRGTTCGTDWNECLMGIHRCDDAATCVNTPGSYACKCDPGYTGTGVGSQWLQKINYKVNGKDKVKTIQHGCKDIDDCDAAEYDGTGRVPGWEKTWNHGPCKYGTCTDVGPGAYHCKCWDGWTDSNCDTNINECDTTTGSSECSRFATCVNLPGKGNPAPKKPAANTGAKCDHADSSFNTDAKCEASGTDMGKMIKGAKCKDSDAKKCTKKECCQLPSVCSDSNSPFKTNKQCRAKGMGVIKRKGKCLDKDPKKCTKEECCEEASMYTCQCNQGYKGNGFSCEDKEDCKKNACSGHGFCTDLGVDQYKCACDLGWEDANCGKNINECTSFTHECGDNAECVDTRGSYYCKCPKGFVGWDDQNQRLEKGQTCIDIDDCAGNGGLGQCRNAEKCTDGGVDVYVCTCKNGWTDYNCDFDINECLGSHECWQGGPSYEKHHKPLGVQVMFKAAKCINTLGSYECQCPKGMIGHGLKTNKIESMTNGAYKVKLAIVGEKNVQKLPTGCIDYDDCKSPGKDNMHGSGDKGEGLIKFKCGEKNKGKCKDTGAKSFRCDCEAGWGCKSAFCDTDCDECEDGTHDCSPHAMCENMLAEKGSVGYACTCKYPRSLLAGSNGPGYYGAKHGKACFPCTVCENGFRAKGICKKQDRTCEDINECADETWHDAKGVKRNKHACSQDATCTNTAGSFTCKCNNGFFASTTALDARRPDLDDYNSRGCTKCTVCRAGFHVVQPCTSISDTVCVRDIKAFVPVRAKLGGEWHKQGTIPFDANDSSGIVIIKSEADENLECLTIKDDDWFPSRVDYGGAGQCGAPSARMWKKLKPRVMWSFTGLGDNSLADERLGHTDLYLIRYKGKTGPCLFFGDHGKDIYPSVQHCKDYPKGKGCPWSDKKAAYCGFKPKDPAMSSREGVLANAQAIWRVTTLKLSEDKFILQSAAKGQKDMKGKPIYDCIVFEKQGTATNPSRYNWGNGNRMCGVGNWGDTTLSLALMNNKQAVFILESYTNFKHSLLQYKKHQEFIDRRRKNLKMKPHPYKKLRATL